MKAQIATKEEPMHDFGNYESCFDSHVADFLGKSILLLINTKKVKTELENPIEINLLLFARCPYVLIHVDLS